MLILIIAGSLWLAYRGYTHQREAGRRRPRQEMRFQCTQCGHEFGMTPREFADQAAKEDLAGKPLGLANCPECSGKQCSRRMARCPQCKKHSIPSGQTVCPHCDAELVPGTSEKRRRRDD